MTTATVVLPRAAAEAMRDMLAAKGTRFDILDAAIADHVPWRHAARMVAQLRGYLDPTDIGPVDQTAAEITKFYRRSGVDIRDERNLFVALATISLLTQAADTAARIGAIDTAGHRASLVPIRSTAVVLATLAPDEAR